MQPFENQFLICGIDYIEALGISKYDHDLVLVGNDWVASNTSEAFERIVKKIQNAQKN